MRLLVALELLLIAVTAIAVVARLPIWAFADERAHAAYVDSVGKGHLPLLGKDRTPPEVAAVAGPPSGFAGMSYEAFQPPLYYAVAAVAWDAARAIGGTSFAVRSVRALDVIALGVTLALLWALARRVGRAQSETLVVFAVALTFLAWPGVVFRSVTVSNTALEMPLASGALLALWIAWSEGSIGALIAASVVCGFGLLCRLPFPPVVLVPIVAWRFRHVAPRTALAALLVPVLMLAPWLLDNLHRYGAITASSVVREMQGGFLNAGDRPYGIGRLVHTDTTFLNGLLPEEWSNTTLVLYQTPHSLPVSVLHATRVLVVVLVGVPLLLWVVSRPPRTWLLVASLLLGIVLTQLDTIVIRLPLVQARYLYPLLPAFGLAGGLALVKSVGYRWTAATAAGITITLAGLWAYLATVPALHGG